MAVLDLTVGWRSGVIADISVHDERPQPSRVLVGSTPAVALAMLGRLYAVCGRAQRACAELALAAAGGLPLPGARRAQLARVVGCEAVQEHLWRLMLDWPVKLGLSPLTELFKRWYGSIGAGEPGWAAALLEELADRGLGVPLAQLSDWRSLALFDQWSNSSPAALATLFQRLHQAGVAQCPSVDEPCDGTLAAECACTLAGYAEHPWLAALAAQGRWLEAHVGARLVGAVALATALAADAGVPIDMDAEAPAPGRGLAIVTTARGILAHDLTLVAGRIAAYAIRTPTDCNFAPDGAFVRRVVGRRAPTAEAARRCADLWALALDPCVSYAVLPQMEGSHA
ncbi:MAG TPA: hypothetical protein VN790_09175 [Steroidobacteraceae bacterium]|nr:hypothetical protein [Steroidobacteraceae bacterium]